MKLRNSFFGLICLVLLAASVSARADNGGPVLMGADGKPLPTWSAGEILDFMRTAREISSKDLAEGITRAKKLRLKREDVEMNVIFHHIDRNERKVKHLPNGNTVMYLRDSYLSQTAAYDLSRLLGMNNVPPTILRRSDGLKGSVQVWIEEAMTEEGRQKKGLEPPNYSIWNQRYSDMRIFDNLINNIDRNQNNMLVDPQWNLWLIDHTRAFGRDRDLPYPEAVLRCSHELWQSLQDIDEGEIRRLMEPYLIAAEIEGLLERREKLMSLLRHRIEQDGEDKVLFNYGDPDPLVQIEYDDEVTEIPESNADSGQ